MSSIRPLEGWAGRHVPTLEVLLWVREQLAAGVMPEMFIGRADVFALLGFVRGLRLHLYCAGVEDAHYQEFIAWLRDVKKEHIDPGGWPERFLSDSSGDHHAAITKFLDRCAEYMQAPGRSVPGSEQG